MLTVVDVIGVPPQTDVYQLAMVVPSVSICVSLPKRGEGRDERLLARCVLDVVAELLLVREQVLEGGLHVGRGRLDHAQRLVHVGEVGVVGVEHRLLRRRRSCPTSWPSRWPTGRARAGLLGLDVLAHGAVGVRPLDVRTSGGASACGLGRGRRQRGQGQRQARAPRCRSRPTSIAAALPPPPALETRVSTLLHPSGSDRGLSRTL